MEHVPSLNQLMPFAGLTTRAYLLEKGFPGYTVDNLVKRGELLALAPGVYRRPDQALTWQGAVSSLQGMGRHVVLGGLSALEQAGFGHYVSLSTGKTIHLYGEPLPTWINNLGAPETFEGHSVKRLYAPAMPPDAFTFLKSWGDGIWNIRTSTPERALMEVLGDVPERVSFEHADQLMQGLTTLSPRRLDELLHAVQSVKVKRLFFWLAERHGYSWLAKLKAADYDLGSGKRVLAKNGRLDRTYQITVPQDMHG